MPAGEVIHEVGRAYLEVLLGALERSIRRFSRTFEVHREPEKLTFTGQSGISFSFDASGLLRLPYARKEVFIESKGYQDGSQLLDEYRSFLARAYAVSVQHSRHTGDLFWFVTNVPFGTSHGRGLTSPDLVHASLTKDRNKEVQKILGAAPIDERFSASLAGRVSVCILTDSFIQVLGVNYRVKKNETLWSILKLLHGGELPTRDFLNAAWSVVHVNDNLEHPDRIKAGQRLHVPWWGMRPRRVEPLAALPQAPQS